MKVLLLIPPTDLSVSYGGLKDFANPVPSLGIAYIAALLRKDGYPVSVLDGYVCQLSIKEAVNRIVKERPDILGISLLTPSASVSEEIAKNIHRQLPETKIIMGNIHASIYESYLLKNKIADIICHKEGEITFLNLVKALDEGRPLKEVNGISFLDNEQVVNTLQQPLIDNLDDLPFPAWDLFPMSLYKNDPRTKIRGKENQKEIQILATRGCPNACTFCTSRTSRSQGQIYRMRHPSNIVDEIEFIMRHFGITVFSFMDLAFPLVKKHGMALCEEIIRRGLDKKISWFSECRVRPLDEELLVMMKRAGCVRLCFGIESGNDFTIQALRKGFNIEDVRRAVDMAVKAKLEVDGMFMLGLPGENYTAALNTINFACELKLRFAIFNLFVPYPGCELFDTLSREGKIKYFRWSDFSSYWTFGGGEPVYIPDSFTKEDLIKIQQLAMHKFYLKWHFVRQQIKDFHLSHLKQYLKGLIAILRKRS